MVANSAPIIAVIPARGGSKGIPRKNIRPLAGFPLIAYSIAAARMAHLVDRVIVSTEDEEIAEVARRWGAETPFLRPSGLAGDDTVDLPVFTHVLDWLRQNEGVEPSILLQVRPTSPLRPPDCLDGALAEFLKHPGADSLRAVTVASQTPYKMWRIESDGFLAPLLAGEQPEPYNQPRQKLPVVHWQTGHVEVVRTRTILEKCSLTGDRVLPWEIDGRYAIDLDTPAQWALAERVLAETDLPRIDPSALLPSRLRGIRLLVTDFDGVMTDNTVTMDREGRESVACSRADGLGLVMLRRAGVPVVVLSTETNDIVTARCRKLELPCIQSVDDKGAALERLAVMHDCRPDQIAFVGNDLNDLPALNAAGFAVAVADAHPIVRRRADLILSRPGGRGAIRELCELILADRHRRDDLPAGLSSGGEPELSVAKE